MLGLPVAAVVGADQTGPADSSPAAGAASAPRSGWQAAAPFPILVTALLVTLCGQVELFGGGARRASSSTPLL